MLLQGPSADLGYLSLIYLLVFEHEELGKCTVILTAERLSGHERRKDALLSISSHLPQHILIVLILVVRDLWQSDLVATILVLVFF